MSEIPNSDYYLLSTFTKETVTRYNQNITIFTDIFIIYTIIIAIYLYCRDKKWYRRIYVDSITGGYSYERFREEYEKMENPKALIVLDIHNFDLMNKYYSNDFCLDLLKKLYGILMNNLAEKGCCTRKFDDCFIVCLNYDHEREILSYIKKVDHQFKDSVKVDFNISLDYGIYKCGDEELSAAETKAVVTWKNVKKMPNNYYAFYEEEKLNTILENNILLTKLEKALADSKLDIYFQAKYDVKTKKIIGSEALLRWRDDDGSFISPQRFIPIAEETGFVTKIDSYVLNKVCSILASLKKEGLKPGTVSINVSRNKLGEEGMVHEYASIFKKYNISKEEIELEITEGTVLADDEVVHRVIQELIQKNFSILIDDFGTGYSSISMLKNLQMKGIKIDRAFVIDETKKGKEILKYVVTLAKGLNLETIAEGVEEESQYKYLKELGCDGIQGYYFSKPMPLEEYKKLLKK